MTVNAYLTSMIDANVDGDLWCKVKFYVGIVIKNISHIMEAAAHVMI